MAALALQQDRPSPHSLALNSSMTTSWVCTRHVRASNPPPRPGQQCWGVFPAAKQPHCQCMVHIAAWRYMQSCFPCSAAPTSQPANSSSTPCGMVACGNMFAAVVVVQASLLDDSWQRSEKILEHGPIEGLPTYCLYSEWPSCYALMLLAALYNRPFRLSVLCYTLRIGTFAGNHGVHGNCKMHPSVSSSPAAT